jgi:hypothetical protein
VPATARAEGVIGQLQAIRRTIEAAEQTARARLLDSSLEKVIARFDVRSVGPGKMRRAVLRSVELIPRQMEAARHVLSDGMAIGATRTASAVFHLLTQLFQAENTVTVRTVPEDRIRQLHREGLRLSEIARQTGVSRWVVWRVLGPPKQP